ncbi:MAG: GUN4 domain-containing protein [Snowella sp.]|nr:GUN4 domain-containing protein [Snowella sp.]
MAEEEAKKEESKSEKEEDVSDLPTQAKTQKWLNNATITLIQWFPLGSSGWLLVSFIKDSQIMQALITFPLTGLAVAWAAYSKGFLAKLQTLYEGRGDKDAESLVNWQDKLDQAIKWQLAGTEDKYLRCQGNEVDFSRTEGLNTFKPLLKDVFVPLELSGTAWRSPDGHDLPMPGGFHSQKSIEKFLQKADQLRIWDILKRSPQESIYRSMVIQAWGGYGKTTLLRHVTYIYCKKLYLQALYKAPKLLPVLLDFRQWQKVILEEKPDLPTLIEKYHLPYLPGGKDVKFPPNWAKHWLSQKNGMLVMFDGFDEVKEQGKEGEEKPRSLVSRWVGQQMRDYPNAVFILTSRPAAYRLDFDAESKFNLSFYIKGLNADQRERFIQSWYHSHTKHFSADPNLPAVAMEAYRRKQDLLQQLTSRPELEDLAKNPLMLAIIVNLHASYDGASLPDRRVDLYRAIIRLQLGDRPFAKKIDLLLPLQDSQRVLQQLALFMVQGPLSRIEERSLLAQLQKGLDFLDSTVESAEFLKQMEEVSELLVKVDYEYEFAHRQFQSYLSACEIIDTNQESLLLANWQETEWKDTILMYASLANATQFITNLLGFEQQAARDLAYECFQCLKAANRRIDLNLEKAIIALESTVETSLYQQLETFLQNGQWKEADRETDRLMLRIVGKEADQWLSVEDIQNFPCEDLRAIDKLWVDYSQGKFGFSVQKKVWMECGGIFGENDWGVYTKFGDQVGWRRSGNWLSYDELTFYYEEAEHAYLPAWWQSGQRRGLMGRAVFFLAQRLVTCNIS